MGEDYIKFKLNWEKAEAFSLEKLKELNDWRNKLYGIGLIGAYENGIGFGNISIRSTGKNFFISGSATGNIEELNQEHYCEVVGFELEQNSLKCKGPIKASSESMTHAAIYESDENANAVVHVHNLKLWAELIGKVPETKKEVEYGTVEMAMEIKRLFKETEVKEKKIIVMIGHKEGVISFGKNLEEAGNIMLKYFNELVK